VKRAGSEWFGIEAEFLVLTPLCGFSSDRMAGPEQEQSIPLRLRWNRVPGLDTGAWN
jgi:hypothetical protein